MHILQFFLKFMYDLLINFVDKLNKELYNIKANMYDVIANFAKIVSIFGKKYVPPVMSTYFLVI